MIFSDKDKLPEACKILPSDGDKRTPRDDVSITRQGGVTTIDVRGLEPPQPLVGVLSLLESTDVDPTVIVLHDRDPVLLYPELEERGWTWETLSAPEGELHLRLTLTRNTGAEG